MLIKPVDASPQSSTHGSAAKVRIDQLSGKRAEKPCSASTYAAPSGSATCSTTICCRGFAARAGIVAGTSAAVGRLVAAAGFTGVAGLAAGLGANIALAACGPSDLT